MADNTSTSDTDENRSATGVVILVILIIGFIGLLWYVSRPEPTIIQGEVTGDRYDVSARASGRIAELLVDVGDRVNKGDVMARLHSPELSAQRDTEIAAVGVAQANYLKVINVRPEDVAAREADVEAANADIRLKELTLLRQRELREKKLTSQANLDKALRDRDAAVKKRDALVAQLRLTERGPSQATRDYAKSQIEQAKARLAATETQINELTVLAPVTGLVTARPAELGENFNAGVPLYTLVDMSDLWFTFNIREDFLHGLKVGDRYKIMVPALDSREVMTSVTVINVLGQFATWRATRATGDFDLRTFEVRAEAVSPVDGLRPGMSAIVSREPQDKEG